MIWQCCSLIRCYHLWLPAMLHKDFLYLLSNGGLNYFQVSCRAFFSFVTELGGCESAVSPSISHAWSIESKSGEFADHVQTLDNFHFKGVVDHY